MTTNPKTTRPDLRCNAAEPLAEKPIPVETQLANITTAGLPEFRDDVPMPYSIMDSRCYRFFKGQSLSVLICLHAQLGDTDNGRLSITFERASHWHISQRGLSRAIAQLLEFGVIHRTSNAHPHIRRSTP
jgi:hypothetical protein